MDVVQANVGIGLGVVRGMKFINGITDGVSLAVLNVQKDVQFHRRILGCCFLEEDASLFK